MTIIVKYFGLIADVTKSNEEIITTEKADFSTKDLLENLTHKYPDLNENLFVIAVNKMIASDNLVLKNNDTIAILPPFAGG